MGYAVNPVFVSASLRVRVRSSLPYLARSVVEPYFSTRQLTLQQWVERVSMAERARVRRMPFLLWIPIRHFLSMYTTR